MNRKALVLLSGGLDSLLAAKLILDQGVEVVGLHFTSPLCNALRADAGEAARKSAAELGIPVIVRDKGPEYVEMVRYPRYGRGKNMNPCIDCRIFMFKASHLIMREEGASFIVTGEVLGQRPMSQRRDAMRLIDRESGTEGLVVRPLSAKLFPPTVPEQEGILDREQLLAVAGRGRKEQYDLVDRYQLREFSKPAGGCLLTDRAFSGKLSDLLSSGEDFSMRDIELLRVGRHFRLGATKLVLGRDKEENESVRALWEKPYVLVTPMGFKGPLGITKGMPDDATLGLMANIISSYGKNTMSPVTLELFDSDTRVRQFERTDIDAESYRIKERT